MRKSFSKLPIIEMDDEQMDKVFWNILDNAVETMPERGILTIYTEHDEENNKVVIKIHNTGTSISRKHMPHIFKPFYTLRKGKGTGLGLAIARNVVLRHGGKIDVESRSSARDKGVAFIIRLPVVQTSPKEELLQHEKFIKNSQ